ncbi:MAG: hypothetical protein K0041_04590 [Acidithiobacillus sp.]|nr:hypothetical protein [Acidithiobacillus sp.]
MAKESSQSSAGEDLHPATRWPRFRPWAIALAVAIAVSSTSVLSVPDLSPAAPFWVSYLLALLRFMVFWTVALLVTRIFFAFASAVVEIISPEIQNHIGPD